MMRHHFSLLDLFVHISPKQNDELTMKDILAQQMIMHIIKTVTNNTIFTLNKANDTKSEH